MQETLKIYSTDGEQLLERDLSGVTKPLMILMGDRPQMVETVPQGADVLGAVVRDEDGWTLASAKDDRPVSSGPKVGADFHLTAGVACSLGPWIFRIEREGAAAGTVLLWRVGSSVVVADPLVQGRNIVAGVKGGGYEVNPAVPGVELCSIFPTSTGVDVVTPGDESQRLAVPFSALFAVGTFQGMALSAVEAAAAVKSGSPFRWTSRKTRSSLMAMAIVVGLVCLGVLAMVKEKGRVDRAIAAKGGVEQSDRQLQKAVAGFTDEDVLVYRFSFYRSLPLILKAGRSTITRDLIRRGEQLSGHIEGDMAASNETDILAIIRFLKDVDAIQGAVQRGDWNALREILAKVDRAMFTRCDADVFYDDAKEIVDFITVELPRLLTVVSEPGSRAVSDAEARIHACFDNMSDNVFMSGEVVRRERDNAQERWRVLAAYVPARERFLSSSDDSGAELQGAWADMTDLFDPEDPAFAPMLKREREVLVKAILARAEKARAVSLIRLCALGEAVGIEDSKLAEWRGRAAEARKGIASKYREMYSDYRMRAAVAPDAPDTLAVLDAMLALGLDDNPFHQWAVREKERVAAKGKDKAEDKEKKK